MNLPSGAWVAFGLAAAITTVVAAVRLHRRRTARLHWPIPLTATAPPPQPPIAVMAAATAAHPVGTRPYTTSPSLIPNPPDTPTATGLTADGVRGDSYALLAQLAAYPAGRTLEQLVAALHPGVEPKPAKQRTHTAVTSLRRVLRDATHLEDQQFLINENNHYRIDPAGIDVDLWRMLTAIHEANHATTDADTLTALQHAADTYGGDFASGIDHLWASEHATTYRHHILDVLARIAELHETDQPDAALAALHQALDHDPLNEELYQRIMRIQGRLGRPDAVRRTLQLCEARLADIQAEPSPATRRVAIRQFPRTTDPAATHRNATNLRMLR